MDTKAVVAGSVLAAGIVGLVLLLRNHGDPVSIDTQNASVPTLLGSGGQTGSESVAPVINLSFPDTTLPSFDGGGFNPPVISYTQNNPNNQTSGNWLSALNAAMGAVAGGGCGCGCGNGGGAQPYTSPSPATQTLPAIAGPIPQAAFAQDNTPAPSNPIVAAVNKGAKWVTDITGFNQPVSKPASWGTFNSKQLISDVFNRNFVTG